MGVEPNTTDKLLGVLHQHACAFIKVQFNLHGVPKILIPFIFFIEPCARLFIIFRILMLLSFDKTHALLPEAISTRIISYEWKHLNSSITIEWYGKDDCRLDSILSYDKPIVCTSSATAFFFKDALIDHTLYISQRSIGRTLSHLCPFG